MSLLVDVKTALNSLAAGGAHYKLAPPGTVMPFIVFQGAGGEALTFLEDAVPDLKNKRLQVYAWSTSPVQVEAILHLVEKAITEQLGGRPIGAAQDDYDEPTKRFGFHQDFSLWYRP